MHQESGSWHRVVEHVCGDDVKWKKIIPPVFCAGSIADENNGADKVWKNVEWREMNENWTSICVQ